MEIAYKIIKDIRGKFNQKKEKLQAYLDRFAQMPGSEFKSHEAIAIMKDLEDLIKAIDDFAKGHHNPNEMPKREGHIREIYQRIEDTKFPLQQLRDRIPSVLEFEDNQRDNWKKIITIISSGKPKVTPTIKSDRENQGSLDDKHNLEQQVQKTTKDVAIPIKPNESMEILLEKMNNLEEMLKNLAHKEETKLISQQEEAKETELISQQEEAEKAELISQQEEAEETELISQQEEAEETELVSQQEEAEETELQQKRNYIKVKNFKKLIKSKISQISDKKLRNSDKLGTLNFVYRRIDEAVQLLIELLKRSKRVTISEDHINLLYSLMQVPRKNAPESYQSEYFYVGNLRLALVDDNNNKMRISGKYYGLFCRFFDDLIELSVDIIIDALPHSKKGKLQRSTIGSATLVIAEDKFKNRIKGQD